MSQSEKKLFLLDAFALIYRAYFGFGKNHRYNSKGMNTSAALGFTNTLLDVLRREKPTHIAVVFDAPAITLREQEFTNYKAGRQEMPEDIRSALPYIKEIIKGFNIPMYLKEGYEADDVVGTIAKQAEKEGFTTYMMTPDKDFCQLVSENIYMYKPARGGNAAEILGIPEVCKKFEIKDPLQVIDILGLWGDAVDNIPGIPGIGEKTSKKLIGKYGSMENLFKNTDDLKGKQKENVINFEKQGLLSKKLATIILDVPVEYSFDAMKIKPVNKELLKELFTELEFRTTAKKVLGEEIVITPTITSENGQIDLFSTATKPTEIKNEAEENLLLELKTIENTPHEYFLIETKEKRNDLVTLLKKSKEFCFDTETTSLSAIDAEVIGISFSCEKGKAYYVVCSTDFEETKTILQEFKAVLESDSHLKIAQNLKYDYSVLIKYGITVAAPFYDTMVAHYLIQPDRKHGMDTLAEQYLGYAPIKIETLIGKKGKLQGSMRDLQPAEIKDYAAEDADITFQLKTVFVPTTSEKHLKKLMSDIEMPLIPILAKMELEGINLDVNALEQFSKELDVEIVACSKKIIDLAGTDFNIDSPKQLGQILFEVLKITEKAKKTKTGQYSTGEEVLQKLVNKHDIIPEILTYRTLKKLKSTYVDPLPLLINPKTKRIHTSFMQTVAATGRLSSTNPNLQNIPIKTEKGREIRKAFIPKNENHILVAADYSQIELRIIAALSGDENMINAFQNNLDIHTATAAKIFKVEESEVDREMRGKAKAVNFGIIYGQSAFGLSQNLNIKRGEAKEIIDSYFEQYPKIKTYMLEVVEKAKEKGYVETILGRRRYLKDINSSNAIVRGHAERNAINAPIQGSAADIIKGAMIGVQKELDEQKLESKMILQVHDELVFDVPKEEVEQLNKLVQFQMENAIQLTVPLTVEINNGNNWLDAH